MRRKAEARIIARSWQGPKDVRTLNTGMAQSRASIFILFRMNLLEKKCPI